MHVCYITTDAWVYRADVSDDDEADDAGDDAGDDAAAPSLRTASWADASEDEDVEDVSDVEPEADVVDEDDWSGPHVAGATVEELEQVLAAQYAEYHDEESDDSDDSSSDEEPEEKKNLSLFIPEVKKKAVRDQVPSLPGSSGPLGLATADRSTKGRLAF